MKKNIRIAKCSFDKCTNPAEWVIGTWQCCDEHAKKWVIGTWQCCDEHAKKWVVEKSEGEGISRWGTSKRIGQKAILGHNVLFKLDHLLI